MSHPTTLLCLNRDCETPLAVSARRGTVVKTLVAGVLWDRSGRLELPCPKCGARRVVALRTPEPGRFAV